MPVNDKPNSSAIVAPLDITYCHADAGADHTRTYKSADRSAHACANKGGQRQRQWQHVHRTATGQAMVRERGADGSMAWRLRGSMAAGGAGACMYRRARA